MTSERRETLRFDTCCLVRVQSAEHGISHCVVRNLSEGGIFLQTHTPLPIGAAVRVLFDNHDDPRGGTCIAAIGEVKNHYFIHYNEDCTTRAVTGMGVRFMSFEDRSDDTCIPRVHPANVTVH